MIASNAWIFAAITVPLTLFTFVVWGICVRYQPSQAPDPSVCTQVQAPLQRVTTLRHSFEAPSQQGLDEGKLS